MSDAEPRPMPPAIPGYEFCNNLGNGCWGKVYLYRQLSTGGLYACKFFDPDPAALQQMQERAWTEDEVWRNECLGGNTKSLPGLAYGSLEALPDGTRFFRREYVDRLLSDVIREQQGRLSLDDIILVANGMAIGLQSIHGKLGRVYGDLKPDNISFTTEKDVKLIDFGTATVGENPRKYGGELFTRAPERCNNDARELHKSSDVWSAGAILYRLLCGEYPLEQELKNAHHPEEIVRALYTSSVAWNERMTERVNRISPRAFRPLLYKSLCHEDQRLKDSQEFSKELEKAVRRYHRSTPRARFFQAAAGLAALSVLSVAGAYFYQLHEEQASLLEQKQKAEKALLREKKNHIVRLYVAGIRFPSDYGELAETGKLQGWVDIFGDKKTAVAAYFDRDAVAAAIFEAGGKTDFQSIEAILLRTDISLVGSVWNATSDAVDGWMWSIRGESQKDIIEEWKKSENSLTDRCNALVGEYHQLRGEIIKYEHEMDSPGSAGIAWDVISEKKKRTERKQNEIIETLASLTGKSAFDIDGLIRDPSFRFSMPPLRKPPQPKPESDSPQSEQGD